MSKVSHNSRRGFTFVELLAVVLVLAVLAAVAIPIYMNSRRSSAARTCKANVATVARAAAAYATRNGAYPTMAQLQAGVPEGIETDLKCPLNNSLTAYSITGAGGGAFVAAGPIEVRCADATPHGTATGTPATEWQKPLPAIPTEPAGL